MLSDYFLTAGLIVWVLIWAWAVWTVVVGWAPWNQ